MKIKRRIITFAIFIVVLFASIYCSLLYLYPKEYSEYVKQYAAEYNLDENMVYAIIKCESNFTSDAISNAGAIGLMQITPDTYEWAAQKANDSTTNKNMLYTPKTNIRYGCYIYSMFLSEFSLPETALACYNAGRGRVKSWLINSNYSSDGKVLDVIPYKETENYVSKVLFTQKIYDFIY